MFCQQFLLNFVTLLIIRFSVCQAVLVSEKCTQDEDCDGFDETTECDLILKICLCNRDHVLVQETSASPITCEPINLGFGEPCKVKEQCTRGVPGSLSDCVPNDSITDSTHLKICHCTEEAVYDPGEHDCHLKRNFVGDDCKVDVQCKFSLGNLSHCYNMNECACSIEAVAVKSGTFCMPIINNVGEECEENQQCTEGKLGNHSGCINITEGSTIKVCDCVDGAEVGHGKKECIKKSSGIRIGEECKVDEECIGIPGISSGCSSSGTCLCLGGYLHSNSTGNCVQIRNELGENCTESQQCQHGVPGHLSACILGKCGCTDFSVNEMGGHFCYRKASLVGDPCEIHEQCWGNLGEKSYCVGGICECVKDSRALDDFSKCF